MLKFPASSLAIDYRKYPCSDHINIPLRIVNMNLTLFCNYFKPHA